MTLSPRQRQVAWLAADGLSNKEIAREIGLSPSTVKNHVHQAIVKLGVIRRAAIGRALERTAHVQEAVAEDTPRTCCRCGR